MSLAGCKGKALTPQRQAGAVRATDGEELLSCRTCFKESRVGLGQVRPATKSYYLVARSLRKPALVWALRFKVKRLPRLTPRNDSEDGEAVKRSRGIVSCRL